MTSTLIASVDAYLIERRKLGWELDQMGRWLRNFAHWAGERGLHTVEAEAAVEWASSGSVTLYTSARRLDAVRRFAIHHQQLDPRTQVPPTGIFGPLVRRPTPYIYSPTDVKKILAIAQQYRPVWSRVEPETYEHVFGLLACTGLRVSEALRLTLADVDLEANLLRIVMTKFRKSRLVPLHPTASHKLRAYRDRFCCRSRYGRSMIPANQRFFCKKDGSPLGYHAVRDLFTKLRKKLNLINSRGRRARIHDLRHSFAVHSLLRWCAEKAPIDHKIAMLSTYLGHVHVSDTYWYFTAIPELLDTAAAKFHCYAHDMVKWSGGAQ